ncbi:putative pathway-specific nitrogen regulator [Golovinomyces cichoracearum]|uniref:Putative pathway-specific nitrogen regulator n=1 Tax=Golovinomyces cichoracearum TaxID=62708 RepID=A0A420IV55_9PEZI|nr:putative pathway-specific nitrogen regulator [Golovinomyces cichoracearum]
MKERSFSGSDETLPSLKGTPEDSYNDYDDRFIPSIDEDNLWTRSESHTEIDDIKRKRTDSIEAQIHAAAEAFITRVGQEEEGKIKDSVSKLRLEESIRSAKMTPSDSEKPHITLRRPPKNTFDSRIEQGSENGTADSSSRHGAEFDDDVFSFSEHSKRSSWNSYHDHQSSADQCKKFTSSTNTGEKADVISPNITSPASSSISPEGEKFLPFTNRKTVGRSTISTPSIRGIQMSPPTGSSFHSTSSAHRNIPSTSKRGTPNSYYLPSKISPSRLKPKKADPLVLLHLTVMPLNYSYSCLMSSPDLPESLKSVQENWRLLLDKLGNTVLERGILLAHPHDSYETLEERLLEALELPIRPRACILKCGHYISQSGSESVSSDDESERMLPASKPRNPQIVGRKWCDICGRDIRLQDFEGSESYERRFRIKIYASNGLMSPGAWAAAWREMERVDVEIEPFVDTYLYAELKRFASTSISKRDEDKADEIMTEDHFHHDFNHESEEEIIGTHVENQEHEMRKEIPHKVGQKKHEEEETTQFKEDRNYEGEVGNKQRRKRNSSGNESIHNPREETRGAARARWSRTNGCNQESLLELLIAATRVFIRERRNVIYIILAILALFVTLMIKRPLSKLSASYDPIMMNNPFNMKFDTTSIKQDDFTTTIVKEITITRLIPTPSEVTSSEIDSEILTLLPQSKTHTSKSSDEEQEVPGKVLQIYSPSVINQSGQRPYPKFSSDDKKERSLSM